MIFQFDSIIELFCYGHDICIMDVARFKTGKLLTINLMKHGNKPLRNKPSISLKVEKKFSKHLDFLLHRIKHLCYRHDKNWYHGGLTTFRSDKRKEN